MKTSHDLTFVASHDIKDKLETRTSDIALASAIAQYIGTHSRRGQRIYLTKLVGILTQLGQEIADQEVASYESVLQEREQRVIAEINEELDKAYPNEE
jgi:hypothetical protein